jgi:hypothetical protein
VTFGAIDTNVGQRIGLYGPGGIGKTTLGASLPGPVAFIDLDESLPRLRGALEASGLLQNIMVVNVRSWTELRSALQSDGWEKVKSIVIDTATKAEEMCVAHTLATVKTEKGNSTNSIEGYGYGKGYTHVYETFMPLLGDLDQHCRVGRNVLLVCHDCTATVPNPAGEDYLRFEPRLQSPASGKASIRLRVREWLDHLLFLGYDIDVTKDGKGRGAGTRTIYTAELPHCMAKSRTTQEQIIIDGQEVWPRIIK